MADHRFATRQIHHEMPADPFGAVIPPVYTAVTYEYDRPTDVGSPYRYGRMAAPTRSALESLITDLEGAAGASAFASGMAAVDAVCSLLDPGDHVVAGDSLYAETHELLTDVYPGYGIEVSRVDTREVAAVADAVRPSTALVYLETPSNPLLHIADIASIADVAHNHDALVAVDNTFASPALQRPIELGADLVVESLTKYVGGHSDVIAGAVAADDPAIAAELDHVQSVRGAIPGPVDCYLALRGARTLSSRIHRQCETAEVLVDRLVEHAAVDRVYYPGLADHPNHAVAADQMERFGAMVSFELAGGEPAAAAFLEALDVFTLAESLGAVESLVEVPSLMTHQDVPPDERAAAGIAPGLVRLSIGTEHQTDLEHDLVDGLDAAHQ